MVPHNYSFKKKYVLLKNYCISRCEKIKRSLKCHHVSLVFHMVTFAKMADVIAVSKLLPYVAKHVWGD
jgi:hypothetical protein